MNVKINLKKKIMQKYTTVYNARVTTETDLNYNR
jgi:hypothetical protein